MRQHQADIECEMGEVCGDSGECWDTHIQGARHVNFTDVAVLYSLGMKATGYLGPVGGRNGLAATASCISAFFDHTLNQESPGR